MKYHCENCNYSTDDRGNWTRHKKSQSHLKKEEELINSKKPSIDNKPTGHVVGYVAGHVAGHVAGYVADDNSNISDKSKFVCPYCSETFGSHSSLYRHKNHRCSKNIDNESNDNSEDKPKIKINKSKKQTEDLLKQIEELKKDKELAEKDKECFKLLAEKDKEYFKALVEKSGNITSKAITTAEKSISALNFVTQNFTNAPALKPIDHYAEIKDYCGDFGVALGVIKLHKDGDLIRYLANLFIKDYKTDDPRDQSIWNSDADRLSYLIRTQAGNTISWITDKRGVQLKDHIKPLLDYLDKEVWTYLKDVKNYTADNAPVFGSGANLIENIRNSSISDEFVKYIAPIHLIV